MTELSRIVSFLGLIAVLMSCDDELDELSDTAVVPIVAPAHINAPPAAFEAEVSERTKNTALIRWTEAVDPDEDKVAYSIVLAGREIAANLDSTAFTVRGLAPETEYSGYVLARDPQNDSSSTGFTFTTKSPYTTFSRYYSTGEQSARITSIAETRDDGYVNAGTTYKRSIDHWILGCGVECMMLE